MPQRTPTGIENIPVRFAKQGLLGKEHDIEARPRASQITAKGAHAAFRRVAPDRVALLFARNKSNTTQTVVLLVPIRFIPFTGAHDKREIGGVNTKTR